MTCRIGGVENVAFLRVRKRKDTEHFASLGIRARATIKTRPTKVWRVVFGYETFRQTTNRVVMATHY